VVFQALRGYKGAGQERCVDDFIVRPAGEGVQRKVESTVDVLIAVGCFDGCVFLSA
jgi:hypothetical protein